MLEDSGLGNMKENTFREDKQWEFLQPGPQPGPLLVVETV